MPDLKVIQRRNMKRAQKMAQACREFIGPRSQIIDVGSGNGLVGSEIQKIIRSEVIGIDTVDYNSSGIKFRLYDGKNIPFEDNSFDYALLIEMLHHCEDQLNVLREAIRVTKKRFIVFEPVYYNFLHLMIMKGYDFLMNFRHGVNTPFNFRSLGGWLEVFRENGLMVKVVKRYPSGRWYSPMKTRIFVLDK